MSDGRDSTALTESIDPDDVADRADDALAGAGTVRERAREQLRFAAALAAHRGNDEWVDLVRGALADLETADHGRDPEAVVRELESTLAPIGDAAEEYTVHYAGHAHIDMNWLWDYPETVHTTYRAFTTMFDIMDEHPEFRFTQSQASTYDMMTDHAPEVVDEIRDRIEDGQWEVAANTWVQGDKNMASGESQARQFLYTDEFVEETLDAEATPVDFEPDTFGHPQTTPKILRNAGIEYYYLGRSGGDQQPDHRHGVYGEVPQLFWWQSPDGSRVLTFNGAELWYNGHVDPSDVTDAVLDFEAETGLREFLDLYGVGDHGGGPTREDVETILRMNEWPVFPETVPSTLEAFFEAVEAAGTDDLAVVEDELNFMFRGCYSSQSRAKAYNRHLEALLPTVESLSVIAGEEAGFEYPADQLRDAWQLTLFNQFHDILPGAGVNETYDHALGRYQEAEATADLVRDRAIDALDDDVTVYQEDADAERYAENGIPLFVFNPTGRPTTSHVTTLVYDYPEAWDLDDLVAVDPSGEELPVQVFEDIDDVRRKIGRGEYSHNWLPDPSRLMHDVNFGPQFARVSLTVPDVPGYGYKVIRLQERPDADTNETVSVSRGKDAVTVENEYYRIRADARRGGLTSLFDKRHDVELVPDDDMLCRLSVEHEAPHGMSAWVRGQITGEDILDDGWQLDVVEEGPTVATLRWQRDYRDSSLTVDLTLAAGTPDIEWSLDADWQEVGDDDRGVPALRLRLPVSLADPVFRYDVPYGVEQRPADGMDVPACEWADVSDATNGTGLTVSNDTTYGHSADGNALSLTLLRSSYSPDRVPEVGRRQITCSLRPHGPDWDDVDAARYGRSFARSPVVEQLMPDADESVVADEASFVSVDEDQVAVECVKRPVDGDGVIVRLHELGAGPTTANVSVAWPVATAAEVDFTERSQAASAGDAVELTDNGFKVDLEEAAVRTVRLELDR